MTKKRLTYEQARLAASLFVQKVKIRALGPISHTIYEDPIPIWMLQYLALKKIYHDYIVIEDAHPSLN